MTAREAYLLGREHLRAAGCAEAEIEAELLLARACGVDRTALYMRWESPLADAAWDRFRRLLEERAAGRPLPYILGHREFMGLRFAVDERVMIPRPETEVLVEFVLGCIREPADRHNRPSGSRAVLVDVGTGSGCIAVSLAHALPQAEVYATDISPEALAVARANAVRHGVAGRITFACGDLLQPLPAALAGRVDAVISNPPYVPEHLAPALPREISRFEPAVAVFAPGDGLAVHRRLIAQAPGWLRPGGLLAMEVGTGQASAVAAAVEAHRGYDGIRVVPDLGGVGRVVAARTAR